jgi:hypothetical protein
MDISQHQFFQTALFDSGNDPKAPLRESYEPNSPAAGWAEDETKHALDELFNATYAYRRSDEFSDLMKFVRKFHYYSPYNAMLINLQRPGANFVASPARWIKKYNRKVRINANPILILQPMGPVMFVFDITDTETLPGKEKIPVHVANPFNTRGGKIHGEYARTIENAVRDGIRVFKQAQGSESAGFIQRMKKSQGAFLQFQTGVDEDNNPVFVDVSHRYDIVLNGKHSREVRYATMVHELAHLYCGHIGTPNRKWWPDRTGLDQGIQELEAESVSYLVCSRFGIQTPSEAYLTHFIDENEHLPKISLERIMKTAGLIESMGKKRLKKRKESKK